MKKQAKEKDQTMQNFGKKSARILKKKLGSAKAVSEHYRALAKKRWNNGGEE